MYPRIKFHQVLRVNTVPYLTLMMDMISWVGKPYKDKIGNPVNSYCTTTWIRRNLRCVNVPITIGVELALPKPTTVFVNLEILEGFN
jgi:hypothetical protein